MSLKLSWLCAADTVPFYNLAVEEALMEAVEPDECILYLWQNRKTVVIGRNQNALAECRVSKLEQDGGFLARRSSGGGAVFHDLGNLNFTFIAHRPHYDVEKQMSVLLEAVRLLGVHAEKSGRNDAVIDGKKFSGNAFTQHEDCCCHHGTIMIRVDTEQLQKYLNVSADKLQSKGIASVKSRVCNLGDYLPDLTVEQMKARMLEAFGGVYGGSPLPLAPDRLDLCRVRELEEKYGSAEWRFGRKITCEWEISQRFSWGGVTLQFQLDQGRVLRAAAYSDALDCDLIPQLPARLESCPFTAGALSGAARGLVCENEAQEAIRADLCAWLGGLEL